MDIKREAEEAINLLTSVIDGSRANNVLAYARKQGLMKRTVCLSDGSEHAAAMYAWQLYCNADHIVPATPETTEAYQIVSIMSALEETANDSWSYGAKLIYDMRAASVGPTRFEVSLFLAMEDGWEGDKNELLSGNPHAVGFYCGKVLTLHSTLPGKLGCFTMKGEAIALPELPTDRAEAIELLAAQYVPACIGEGNADKMTRFLRLLRNKSDFYNAINAGDYEEGSLAAHTLAVICKLVELTHPTTPEQMGECVLAGIGHDIAEAHIIVKQDAEGNFVFDSMPFGHGRKSLYILGGYLDNCLPETVASAIDGHMMDVAANPRSHQQMMESPLGLYLHIADVISSFITQK